MINKEHDPMVRLLREALPPVESTASADLWPLVSSGLAAAAPPPSTTEWMLVAAVMLTCVLQPAALSVLLFHF
jgi:hypothetical protein